MSDADTIDSDARRERHEERMIREGAAECLACGALTFGSHHPYRYPLEERHPCHDECVCPTCEPHVRRAKRRVRADVLRGKMRVPHDDQPRGRRGRTT